MLGIRSKLFLLSLGLIALSLGISYGYLRATLDRVLSERIRADLTVRLRLLADAAQSAQLSVDRPAQWQALAVRLAPLSDARVTLLSGDGVLRGDSEVAESELRQQENHSNRPEVHAALGAPWPTTNGGSISIATRHSVTLRQRMMYVAMPFAAGDGSRAVARLAMPLLAVDRAMVQLHWALFLAGLLGLGVAIVMSSAAAHLAARSLRLLTTIATRMAQGDLGTRAHPNPTAGDELAVLGRGLDTLAASLSSALALRRDFVANASHELRTPLASLCSAVETLRSTPSRDPKSIERFIDIIARNADRLHRLVEDLLDLSRIESKTFHLRLTALSVDEVVGHMVAICAPRAEAKEIKLRPELGQPGAQVLAERRSLEQVLSNLLDNAIKYGSPRSDIRITSGVQAGTRAGKRSREMLCIRIHDRGPGIPAEHLPRLFERFYRVDAGRSRALGGTGLGLAIVKHLVEAMDGEVGVESTVGVGSTFWFTLPLSSTTRTQPATGDDARHTIVT